MEFQAEVEAVRARCREGELDAAGLQHELDRLTGLRDALTGFTELRQAGLALDELRGMLRFVSSTPPPGPAMLEAMNAAARAQAEARDGSVAERATRLRSGVREIRAIADRATSADDRYAALRQAETLVTQAEAIELTGIGPPRDSGAGG